MQQEPFQPPMAQPAQQPAPVAPMAPGQAGVNDQPPAATVIYTDAEGNPVAPPPDPLALLPEIRAHIGAGQFVEALEKTEALLGQSVLDHPQKEELLHIRSEMLFIHNRDDLAEKFTEIADATNQAINFDPNSRRNAAAPLRLWYMHLRLKKIPAAEARFNTHRRLFPHVGD